MRTRTGAWAGGGGWAAHHWLIQISSRQLRYKCLLDAKTCRRQYTDQFRFSLPFVYASEHTGHHRAARARRSLLQKSCWLGQPRAQTPNAPSFTTFQLRPPAQVLPLMPVAPLPPGLADYTRCNRKDAILSIGLIYMPSQGPSVG